MILEITKEIGSREKMGSCKARLFVQNFDAVLVVIAISAGDAISAKSYKKCVKHKVTHFQVYGVLYFLGGAFF